MVGMVVVDTASNRDKSMTFNNNNLLQAKADYGFIPGLDGLRALSVLIVMIAHMGFENIVPGGFGVTVFFFISGFLITRLLLAETALKGIVNLAKFYLRRFVRLYPALLFMIFLSSCAYILLGYGRPEPMELAAGVGYFTNIYQVMHRVGGTLPFMPWTHLWSLAVEEHFYLAFPLLLIAFRKRPKGLVISLIGVIVAATLWRTYTAFATQLPIADYNYMMTDTRIDSLAWGCLLSVLLNIKSTLPSLHRLTGVIPTAVGFIGLVASFLIRDDLFRYTLRFSVQGLSIFLLILNLYYWPKLRFSFKILDWKPLAWIGTVSYALYLWHVPILDLMVRGFGDHMSVKAVAIVLSFAMAGLSYYCVEKPFLALRRQLGSHVKGGPIAVKQPTSIPESIPSENFPMSAERLKKAIG